MGIGGLRFANPPYALSCGDVLRRSNHLDGRGSSGNEFASHGLIERDPDRDALRQPHLRRSIALTTPRFLTVPSLVARAPVLVTMQARLARRFAAEHGLSLSPLPVELGEITISLLWHASYDHDPAHAWLRQQVTELAAEL
jgi:DNA-binding transcriptional LysR family regulator